MRQYGRQRRRKRWGWGNILFAALLCAAGLIAIDIASLHGGFMLVGEPKSTVGRVKVEQRGLKDISKDMASHEMVVDLPPGAEAESDQGRGVPAEESGTVEGSVEDNLEDDKGELDGPPQEAARRTEAPKPTRRAGPRRDRERERERHDSSKTFSGSAVDRIEKLSARLMNTKIVLGKQQTVTGSRLTCGGSHTVQWRSYRELRDSFMDKTKLYRHLPPSSVSLLSYAKAIGESDCFKRHRYNYKHNNCTFEAPQGEQGPHDQAELCAVVGNGGRLRQEYHQEAIDAADVVIRFNQGVTQGFEKHVGTKSTIRMYNGPYISPKQPGEITIAQIREMAIRQWVKQAQKHEGEHTAFMFDPDFLCHAWDWVDRKGEKPSSGLVGIVMSLRLCKHTNVYGFQFDEYFNTSIRPHYYNWERPKPGRENVHPFAQERELYKSLEEMGRLTLF